MNKIIDWIDIGLAAILTGILNSLLWIEEKWK